MDDLDKEQDKEFKNIDKELKTLSLNKNFISLSERKKYRTKKGLESDEKKLEALLKKTKNKFQKIMFLPLALHLMEERKRIIGFRIKDKITYKLLKGQTAIFKKRLVKWGVDMEGL